MVEWSIAWLTRKNRRMRHRGVTKNNHWLHHRVAALSLRRLLTMGLTCTATGGRLPDRSNTLEATLADTDDRLHTRTRAPGELVVQPRL